MTIRRARVASKRILFVLLTVALLLTGCRKRPAAPYAVTRAEDGAMAVKRRHSAPYGIIGWWSALFPLAEGRETPTRRLTVLVAVAEAERAEQIKRGLQSWEAKSGRSLFEFVPWSPPEPVTADGATLPRLPYIEPPLSVGDALRDLPADVVVVAGDLWGTQRGWTRLYRVDPVTRAPISLEPGQTLPEGEIVRAWVRIDPQATTMDRTDDVAAHEGGHVLGLMDHRPGGADSVMAIPLRKSAPSASDLGAVWEVHAIGAARTGGSR